MAGLLVLQRPLLRRILPNLQRRLVSTSKKNNETIVGEVCKSDTKKVEAAKNWISYGFETSSKKADRTAMHSALFSTITLCLVFGGFYLVYLPDYGLKDWSVREAYLEIRRRERNGLPLVDRNLIDPAKINLPTDEELGDTEIII